MSLAAALRRPKQAAHVLQIAPLFSVSRHALLSIVSADTAVTKYVRDTVAVIDDMRKLHAALADYIGTLCDSGVAASALSSVVDDILTRADSSKPNAVNAFVSANGRFNAHALVAAANRDVFDVMAQWERNDVGPFIETLTLTADTVHRRADCQLKVDKLLALKAETATAAAWSDANELDLAVTKIDFESTCTLFDSLTHSLLSLYKQLSANRTAALSAVFSRLSAFVNKFYLFHFNESEAESAVSAAALRRQLETVSAFEADNNTTTQFAMLRRRTSAQYQLRHDDGEDDDDDADGDGEEQNHLYDSADDGDVFEDDTDITLDFGELVTQHNGDDDEQRSMEYALP